MGQEPRLTLATRAVLHVLADGDTGHFGLQIAKQTGLPTGTVYPILVRLMQAGWLEDDWEDIDPTVEQRPPRRFYRLTAKGRLRVEAFLSSRGTLVPGWQAQPGRLIP